MHGDSLGMVAEGNNNMIHPTKLMRGEAVKVQVGTGLAGRLGIV